MTWLQVFNKLWKLKTKWPVQPSRANPTSTCTMYNVHLNNHLKRLIMTCSAIESNIFHEHLNNHLKRIIMTCPAIESKPATVVSLFEVNQAARPANLPQSKFSCNIINNESISPSSLWSCWSPSPEQVEAAFPLSLLWLSRSRPSMSSQPLLMILLITIMKIMIMTFDQKLCTSSAPMSFHPLMSWL